jgi:Tol biopolymer transport system component
MCQRESLQTPFNAPVNLTHVDSSRDDQGPTLSADGLTLLFASDRPGGQGAGDLWISTRASLGTPFGEPVNLGPTVNTSTWDSAPEISSDGLTLLFQSNRPGSAGLADLWVSTRKSAADPFGEPVNLGPGVNSNFMDCTPALSADGRTLLFSSDRPGGQGDSDLWMARLIPPERAD